MASTWKRKLLPAHCIARLLPPTRTFKATARESCTLPRAQAVRGKPMSGEEVDLLYRVFDTNKDGFLELSGAPSPLLPARWHKPRDG